MRQFIAHIHTIVFLSCFILFAERVVAEDSVVIPLQDSVARFAPIQLSAEDSLRAFVEASKYKYHPLCQPLYYVAPSVLKFSINAPTFVNQVNNSLLSTYVLKDYSIPALRQAARTYLVTHHAELYAGIYDPDYAAKFREQQRVDEVHSGVPIQLDIPDKFFVRDAEEERKEALQRVKYMYSPWRREATTMLQLTQNYVSKNWYQGGNSNFAVLGIVKGNINYDNRKNLTWENTGEWRLGMNTVSGDTLRKVAVNEDIFKLYSKLGYKVYKNLSVAVTADFQTHFFSTYKPNTKNIKTGPFTPIRFNLSLGLDYKPVNNLSIVVSPVTYKLVYACDTTRSEPTSYGIENGKNILNDCGSSVRVKWNWKPVREIALESDLYFFTNYARVEIDWDVTCNFIINRYLSACVTLHPRYDNTVILDGQERATLQFKELLSLGFCHKFR